MRLAEDSNPSAEKTQSGRMALDNRNLPEYRFPWLHLAESVLTILNPSTGEEKLIECAFTRAVLKDRDLQVKSEVDKASDEMNGLEVKDQEDGEIIEDQEVVIASDCGDGAAEESNKANSDEFYLPDMFGSAKHSKRAVIRPKNKNAATEWLQNVKFNEYWEEAGNYLVYFTFLHDYEKRMTKEMRTKFEELIVEHKPDTSYTPLLNEHDRKELETNYSNLCKDDPELEKKSLEELYTTHCDLVCKKAEMDFRNFKSKLTRKRCQRFISKIEDMGFVTGFTNSDLPSGDTSGRLADGEKPKKKQCTRFPMVYDEGDLFSDVSYEIFDPYLVHKRCQRGAEHVRDEAGPSNPKGSEVESHHEEATSNDIKDISNISFAFDPEKEAHLEAKNAHEYYKDDPEIKKYYFQRYRLFSRLDEGIIMDREGWFSVTPERIAEHIADRVVVRHGMVVVDAFAGVGGNSIQFALKGARVIAIDLDPVRLKCARHNAKVYGVEDRIEFICADYFHFAANWTIGNHLPIDAVFLSPPWGGPSYLKSKEFLLDEGLTPNGFDIYTAARKMSPNIAYFLPRQTSIKQLRSLCSPGDRLEIEQSCLNKKIKTITAYYGNVTCSKENA